MTRAVFLDRDGVINEITIDDGVPHPPNNAEEFRLLPGVIEACQALHQAGFKLVVVTNQPDVARGTQTIAAIEAINQQAKTHLPIDDIYTCYHDNADHCDCRKPKPGMLLQASKKWGVDLANSFMVGDRYTDIQAGAAAGCRTIFIEGGSYGKREGCQPDWVASSLLDASRIILREKES